jgi:hypothetical protein
LLQILPEAVIDGQRHDQRSDARCDTDNGNAGDDPDKGLPPFGAQVASRDEEFKAHGKLSAVSYQLSAKLDYTVQVIVNSTATAKCA